MILGEFFLTEQPTATFTFKQVETILADLFGVALEKRGTFVARLQQLQKLGLPHGTNVGRGARASYAYWQLAELTLYLDLLDCGYSPNLIKTHFVNPYYTMGGTGWHVEHAPATAGGGLYFLPDISALNYLRTADPERVGPHFADHIMRGRNARQLAKTVTKKPSVAINMTARLSALKEVVGRVVPEYRGLLVFPKL